MKKFALIATLALAATAVSAADYSVFTRYDYDNQSNVSNVELHRATAGVAANFGKIGVVDAGLVGVRQRFGNAHPSDQGVSVGYSNAVAVGKTLVVGRVSYTHLNETDRDAMRYSAEARHPVMGVTGVAGVEHLRVESEAVYNRFIVGADIPVAKNVVARAALARTNFTGSSVAANGLSVGLTYKF